MMGLGRPPTERFEPGASLFEGTELFSFRLPNESICYSSLYLYHLGF